MILVSNVINAFYKAKLKAKPYRKKIFLAAINNELRYDRLGKVILRNLNDLMNENTHIHEEFVEIVGAKDFQEKFWASDLGYLWFEGNANADKPYFNEAINIINNNNISSLLDVGCGWGVFCNKCVLETKIPVVKGIDLSEVIIKQAGSKFKNERLSFEVKDLMKVTDKYEMLTVFGSIDYVLPEMIEEFVMLMVNLASKKVVIVNSLRKIDIKESIELKESKEIKRYDVGYVHPLSEILKKNQSKESYTFTIERSGIDSVLVVISK